VRLRAAPVGWVTLADVQGRAFFTPMKTYAEKLKDPRWQRKRLEVLNIHDFTCDGCYGDGNTLHVHHLYYVSGRDPWEYPNFALTVLCEDCHSFAHSAPAAPMEFERIMQMFQIRQTDEIGFGLWDLAQLYENGSWRLGERDFKTWLINAIQEHIESQPSIHR